MTLFKSFLKVAVTLVLAASLSSCSPGPDKSAETFMSLILAGKHLEAQGMLGKDMKQIATLMGGVSNDSLNDYYKQGRFRSYTLTVLERTENAVRYKVAATTADGTVHEDKLDMVKEEGTWKVSAF